MTPQPHEAVRGFERAHKHWDARRNSWVVQILPGEFYISARTEIISTVLGSCVSTCIRDPRAGLAGMNHFMLPQVPPNNTSQDPLRYGSYAVERLINELMKLGASKKNLEIKIFGGGSVINAATDIGKMNVEFARQYFRDEELPVKVEDVGGRWARRLLYATGDGKALVSHLEIGATARIAKEEGELRNHVVPRADQNDIELF